MSKFAPEEPVRLDPPENREFTPQELEAYNGVQKPEIYVAIKGTVFDVSKNTESYGPGSGGYRVFVGKDASRALAKSSLEPEDVRPEYQDLPEDELKVLDDWYSFFSQRYNVKGQLKPGK